MVAVRVRIRVRFAVRFRVMVRPFSRSAKVIGLDDYVLYVNRQFFWSVISPGPD